MTEEEKKRLIEIEEHGDLNGWVAPLTEEDIAHFVYLRSVFKRLGVNPSRATEEEYEAILALAAAEFYENPTPPAPGQQDCEKSARKQLEGGKTNEQ